MTETLLPDLPSKKTTAFIIAGFFVLTFLVYGASLGNRFVAWDDNYVINFNPVVRGFTWEHLVKAFTTFVDPELYNPVTFVSYQLDYTIGGLKPFIFHFHNLVLHTLNAILVTWFLFILSKKKWIAIVCGLIFAIHPLNTEAVAWASARKDTLSTFFFLLSLIGYLYSNNTSHRSRLHYALSLLAFTLGLLSKVMIITLPIVLLLIDYLKKRTWSKNISLEKIPYVVLSGIFGAVALFGKQSVVAESTALQKMLMACKSTIFYLEKLLWPTKLSVIYPYTKTIELFSSDFFIPVLLVFLLLAAAWTFRNRMREVTFGLHFFCLTLSPTFLNFAKGGEFYFASDRYAYIPQIGILFLIASVAHSMMATARKKRIAAIGCSVLLLIFSVAAYRQSLTWRDTETLFLQTLSHYPDAVAARINLGLVYRESGLPVRAMEQFTKALEIRPNNALVHTNIGATHEKMGKLKEAIAEYEKAIELEPKKPDAYFALGMMQERAGNLEAAFTLYEKVRGLNPGYVGVYNNLGSIYVQRKDYVTAASMYQKAIDIDPYYADAHFNLAFVLEKLGNIDDAEKEYETTLELEGEKIDILRTLVGLYAMQNKRPETIRTLERMLKLNSTDEFALKFMESLNQHNLLK
jgi:Flp pilus assembly protein TadD